MFYESVSSGDWDLTKWLCGWWTAGFWCAVCYYGDSKKIKTFLLADLIIDKVFEINGIIIRIDTIPISSASLAIRRWFAYVIVNKGLTSVAARVNVRW